VFEHCKKKVDRASKGQKFKKLPKILVIQLMRFVFDFTTMRRRKLYDYCAFPLVLNMNLYIDDKFIENNNNYYKEVDKKSE
jgi:uncharacterized UBP type Zn finger protein